MDGMAKKAQRKRHNQQFTKDGLPRDPKDWTEEDWRDLYEATETVKRKIAKRHQEAANDRTRD